MRMKDRGHRAARRVAVAVALLLTACGDDGAVSPDGGGADTGSETGGTDEPLWEAAFDTAAAGPLSGVWGSGPDDVFVVGGADIQGEVYHWDGAAWAAQDVPDGVPLLVWSYGFGAEDVWSVGLDGAAVHWDGAAWTPVETGTDQDLWGVFGFASDDLWVVGGSPPGDAPTILHWDGTAFDAVELDPAQNPLEVAALFKVWGIGSRLFAVGERGLILRWDGEGWEREDAGAKADQDFVSLWGTSEDHIVAVGGRGNARIAVYDGAAWETFAPSGYGGLNAVYMAEPNVAVVGGIYGYVGRFDLDLGELIDEVAPTGLDIHAIWGDGAGRHYAVGGVFMSPWDEGVALVRYAP